MKTDCLILFYKQPIPGQVKTRLAGAVGNNIAAEIYLHILQDLKNKIYHPAWVTQPYCAEKIRYSFDDTPLFSLKSSKIQTNSTHGPTGLGGRMMNAFDDSFSSGYERCILIGSDIPLLTSSHILNSFQQLKKSDCVIGPSTDGGYYLIGFNRSCLSESFFEDICWSSDTVYQETMTRINNRNLLISLGEILFDIDTLNDLNFFYKSNEAKKSSPQLYRYLYRNRKIIFKK